MIENLVDQALATLISTIPGLTVLVGMEDNEPPLATPYCVVHSAIQGAQGRRAIYELLTVIEYVSISGQDTAAGVETTMSAIDTILTTSSLETVLWQNIAKSEQDVGDRRRNIRELKTFASIS